jgi:hypothetical protein
MIWGEEILQDRWFPILEAKKDERGGGVYLVFKTQTSSEGRKCDKLAVFIRAAFIFILKLKISILISPRIVLMLHGSQNLHTASESVLQSRG